MTSRISKEERDLALALELSKQEFHQTMESGDRLVKSGEGELIQGDIVEGKQGMCPAHYTSL